MDEKDSLSIDEKDLRIVRFLLRHQGVQASEAADQLEIPKTTYDKHVGKLMKGCIAKHTVVTDWKSLGFPIQLRVDIRVDQRNLASKSGGPVGGLPEPLEPILNQKDLARYIKDRLPLHDEFVGRIYVDKAAILLGHESDLSIVVHASDTDAITAFVTNGLRLVGGIHSTMTSLETWSY